MRARWLALLIIIIVCAAVLLVPNHETAETTQPRLLPVTAANVASLRQVAPVGAVELLNRSYDVPEGSIRLYTDTGPVILPLADGQPVSLRGVNWSPDWRYVAIGVGVVDDAFSQEQTVQLWRMDSKFPQLLWSAPLGNIDQVSWHPDGERMGVDGRTVNIETGRMVGRSHYFARRYRDLSTGDWYLTGRIWRGGRIDWNPDGTRFAGPYFQRVGSSASDYAVFDAVTDWLLFELEESRIDRVTLKLYWSPDGRMVTDGIYCWSGENGELLSILQFDNMSLGLPDVYWSRDSQYVITVVQNQLVIGGPATRIYVWDARSAYVKFEHAFSQRVSVTSIRDGTIDAVIGSAFRYWLEIDMDTGDIRTAESIDSSLRDVQTLTWSPDSTQLLAVASGPITYPMQLWDRADLLLEESPPPIWTVNSDWFNYETDAADLYPSSPTVFWSDSRHFVTLTRPYYVDTRYQSIDQWRSSDGTRAANLFLIDLDTEPRYFLPDRTLTNWAEFEHPLQPYGADPGRVRILNGPTGSERYSVDWASLTAGEWSPSGRWLATYDFFSVEGTVEFWDTLTAMIEPALIADESPGRVQIVWNPAETRVAIRAEGDTVSVYDLDSGENLAQLPSGWPAYIDWGVDNDLLVVVDGSTMRFWDANEQRIIARMELPVAVTAMDWSPDGTLIATAHADGMIRVWGIPVAGTGAE